MVIAGVDKDLRRSESHLFAMLCSSLGVSVYSLLRMSKESPRKRRVTRQGDETIRPETNSCLIDWRKFVLGHRRHDNTNGYRFQISVFEWRQFFRCQEITERKCFDCVRVFGTRSASTCERNTPDIFLSLAIEVNISADFRLRLFKKYNLTQFASPTRVSSKHFE